MNSCDFLVIGSNSFSGSSFIAHLLSKKYDVVGISRSKEPNNIFLPYKWSSYKKKFNFYQLDMNNNIKEIIELIGTLKPKYVVNFAAQGMVAQSWESPADWYNTNLLSQVKLHDKMRKFKFIKKYVHVTTPEVYGSTSGWIDESEFFRPSTPYAVSRAACDLHLLSFFKAYNLPVVFTRSANVYGVGQQLYRIIPRTILFSRIGRKLKLDGGGESMRSFININDVSSATELLALSGSVGSTYHISSTKSIMIKDLVLMICQMMEISFNDMVEISHDRLGKDQNYLLNSNKIRNEFNWKPLIALKEGIEQTISWIDENIDVVKNQNYNYIHKI